MESDRHRLAWEHLVQAAKTDSIARYGIYASRTLAVRHPEVYLKGDTWFYESASSIKGFHESFRDPTALGWCHMDYGFRFFDDDVSVTGIPDGRPMDFSQLNLRDYRVTDSWRIYPEFYIQPLDWRMGPLAVALKTEGKVVSPIELALIAYYRVCEAGKAPGDRFLVLCAEEDAYLLEGDELYCARSDSVVPQPRSAPVLIFNEEAVWYPWMNRDDSEASPELRRAVRRLSRKTSPTPLDTWQEKMFRELAAVSSLDNEEQKTVAALASVRGKGWPGHPYYMAWQSVLPDDSVLYTISRHMCLIREFLRHANLVSPVTAALSGHAMGTGTLEARLRRLSQEYLSRAGVVREAEARGWKSAWRLEAWGHLWPCPVMEHTIDDAFRSRTAHCISQAFIMSAILEMADVPHLIVHFDRGGITRQVSHHFILDAEGAYLFDDGILNFRGIDPNTEDYGPLHSFSKLGKWARLVADSPYGNVDSKDSAALIEEVDRALDGRFELRFFASKEAGSVTASEQGRRSLSKQEYLRYLSDHETEQVTVP
jgi:hypothetical protein